MKIKAKQKFHESILFRISMVLLVMFAQLTWWIIFTVRDTDQRLDSIEHQITTEFKLAKKLLESSSDQSDTIEFIRQNLSAVQLIESKVAVNQQYYDKLIQRELDKRFMFISESSLFFVFILLSFYLVYRSFREELRLRLLQQNFMLSITHELKTPLASIKLYLQTLQNKPDVNKEKQTLFVENSLSEVNRLNELIENVLYTVKLEQKPAVLNEVEQNLSEYVSQIVLKNQQRFTIDIKQNIETGIYHHISVEALELVLNNLISNAVKYSSGQIEIEINLSLNGSETRLAVSDKGSGVPDNEKQLIFDRFYRIGNEDNRNTEGTGIGLYIVKQIVHLAKGDVLCLDNKPKGSVFVINLKNGFKRVS